MEMIRLACLAASRQPRLGECTPESVLKALMDAAALGITPGGVNGRGYLVPRQNKKVTPHRWECSFDPGYRGLLDIARRSKLIASIEAHVVREKDPVFDVRYGTDSKIEHVPYLGMEDRGQIIASYAIATFKDGCKQVEICTRGDLEAIRACSAAQSGPWADWPDEMSRKTAVRRLVKYLPVEPEVAESVAMALSHSDEAQGNMATRQNDRGLVPLSEALQAAALPPAQPSAAEMLGTEDPQPETVTVDQDGVVQDVQEQRGGSFKPVHYSTERPRVPTENEVVDGADHDPIREGFE